MLTLIEALEKEESMEYSYSSPVRFKRVTVDKSYIYHISYIYTQLPVYLFLTCPLLCPYVNTTSGEWLVLTS